MPTTVKAQQTKAIGWYAVQRVRIFDWLKPHVPKDGQGSDSQQSATQTQSSKSDSKAKSNDESSTQSDSSSQSAQQNAIPDTTPKSNTAEGQADDKAKARAKSDGPGPDSKDAKKLKAVVHESHTILVKAHSVFPFQLFPDAVNIDRHKLTIVRRQFFGVEQKVSVPLENIKNIEADLGPFFGSITITSDLFVNNTQKVHYLLRDEAKKLQKLVQGAVVAQGEGIDLNKIDTKQLRNLLIDLGSGHTKSM